jgi:predicted lipoprotein with Yx(FWY)xxD motif
MKRIYVPMIAVLSAVMGFSALANAQSGPPTAHSSAAARVQLRHTRLGSILVDSSGFTLYEFTKDRGADSCMKISGCPKVWPALQTSGRPTAGPGVRASLLSTVRLPRGGEQVTYAGHPLYLYAEDSSAGETAYVGIRAFGGNWDALTASGRTMR